MLVTRAGSAEQFDQLRAAAGAVLVQEHRELVDAYRVYAVPSAVVVSPQGQIATPLETGIDTIETLLATGSPVGRGNSDFGAESGFSIPTGTHQWRGRQGAAGIAEATAFLSRHLR